ncbi:YigZ family protein [candidate division KSB1 bacterium]|nr:YigZ family protein [candidate division KSB1 bacterium]MBL7092348.1 YigZ family protein [candidate division KSB1 bacterium]
MDEDEYRTIKDRQQAEIKIKGSRFIGTAQPVTAETQAKEFINNISKKYFDASHNCYAYNVGFGQSQISRFNDAGEPSGTAGQPILSTILGKELTDVAVVVTRYFGGTKLGKGGLVRAYSDCTSEVLNKCAVLKKYLKEFLDLDFDYNETGAVMRIINQHEIKIIKTDYDQKTRLKLSIRKSKIRDFERNLIDLTSGKISIKPGSV